MISQKRISDRIMWGRCMICLYNYSYVNICIESTMQGNVLYNAVETTLILYVHSTAELNSNSTVIII